MEIGERIKKKREELGMSQDELAKKVGYTSRSSVAKVETNANGMVQSKLIAFAKALQTTPAYLMGWEDEPDSSVQTTLPRQIGEHFFLSSIQQQIISNCKQLNDIGQQKVLDFSEDLISSNNYTATERYSIAAYGADETEENFQLPDEEITT